MTEIAAACHMNSVTTTLRSAGAADPLRYDQLLPLHVPSAHPESDHDEPVNPPLTSSALSSIVGGPATAPTRATTVPPINVTRMVPCENTMASGCPSGVRSTGGGLTAGNAAPMAAARSITPWPCAVASPPCSILIAVESSSAFT